MSIPSLDLNQFLSGGSSKDEFVKLIGQGFEETGFVAVKNHGLSQTLQSDLYAAIQEFFSLPQEIKAKYDGAMLNGQRGYTGKGIEHAKGSKHGDLKEFYHVGNERYMENVWPSETPQFKSTQLEAFSTLERTAGLLLRAIALYLDLDEDYFEDKAIGGNSILRSIHYYPLDQEDVKPGSVRAGAHGDINLITLLMGASAEGLEILNQQEEWVAVTSVEDHLVVNVGDMLSRLTNNRLKSTVHRVVNPSADKLGESRFSIPFFMHPKPEMDLSCLPTCIDAKHPKLYEDITANEFLLERLREIGLIEK